MKKMLKLALSSVCAAAILTACGGQKTPAEEPSTPAETENPPAEETVAFDLAEMRAINSVQAILTDHDSLMYQQNLYRADDDTVPMSSTSCMYWTDNGLLQMQADHLDHDSGKDFQRGYADDSSRAVYEIGSDGSKYMTVYRAEEYDAMLTVQWLPEPDGAETVQSVETEGDAAVVTTRTDYSSGGDAYYDLTVYTLDAATNLLREIQVTTYDAADDTAVSILTTTVEVDGSYTPEQDAYEAITGVRDACELSVVIAPQQEEQEVQWFWVAHDTLAYVFGDCTLYADAELTQEMPYDGIDLSGEAETVFAVYN